VKPRKSKVSGFSPLPPIRDGRPKRTNHVFSVLISSPKRAKPLRDHPLDFINILQSLETHDKVIGISHHEGLPLTRGLNGFYESFVQHLQRLML